MEEYQSPFTRLKCACTFTESAQRLQKLLDKAESSDKPTIKELKGILSALQLEHKEHVEKHNVTYAHSFVEHYKGGGPVLKTSAFTAGDVKRARNPVKVEGKKTKKRKKKSGTAVKDEIVLI